MNKNPISDAHDPDIKASSIALKRAASKAREIAKITGTPLVVNRNGRTIKIDPDESPQAIPRTLDI